MALSMRACMAPTMASRSSAFMACPVAPLRRMVSAPVKTVTVVVECAAGKAKTRKSAAKRFKVTGTGKLMARKAGKQHFNEKMSSDTKRDLSKMFVLHKGDVYNITKCLPNHGVGGK